MVVKRIKNDELYHHGVEGQKWGVRRYQNKDGSLTDLGRRHYGYKEKMLDKIDYEYKRRKGRMSKSDSAEITIRNEARSAALKTSGGAMVGMGGFMSTAAHLTAGAIGFLNPVTLAASAALAATGTGVAAYNMYKSYKLSEIHDEYQIPKSKKIRTV
jgi:hypothetical protein